MYMQNVVYFILFYMEDALYVSEHRGNTLTVLVFLLVRRSNVLARLVAMDGARWSCLIVEVVVFTAGGAVSGA